MKLIKTNTDNDKIILDLFHQLNKFKEEVNIVKNKNENLMEENQLIKKYCEDLAKDKELIKNNFINLIILIIKLKI